MAAKITVRNNGSLRVEGDIELYDHDGGKYDLSGRTALSFCRCGLSATKPFCNGSHKKSDFKSECKAYVLPPPQPKP